MSGGRRPKQHGDRRRTKAELDPKILEKVLTIVAVGAGRNVAAAQAGISDETLRVYVLWGKAAWAKREAAMDGGKAVKLSKRDTFFADFYGRLVKAESTTQAYMLGLIQKAAHGDWRAGAWLLEKLHRREFGTHVELALEHSGSVETTHDLSRLTSEELMLLRELRRKITEGDDDGEEQR